MEKIENLREFLKKRVNRNLEAFYGRSTGSAGVHTLYNQDGITVNYVLSSDYLEVIGLTFEEYKSLGDLVRISR